MQAGSSKKRIVVCGTTHPFRGGLAVFNERLARELSAQGHEVVVYTFSLQYPDFLFPGKSQLSDEPRPADLDIRVALNSVSPLSWLAVGREIRALAPDLVVMKFWIPFIAPSLGTVARLARRSGRTRVVTIVDNMIPHEARPGDELLIRYFAGSVDAFVAMSESVLDDIKRFDRKKPKAFLPHPIYDNFGPPREQAAAKRELGLEADVRYVLFFGFIRDYKGLDLALEAMADQRLRERDVRLVVAGEFYVDDKPYLDLIERRGIRDRVELRTDFIPDSEVGKYFCAADLVVQPYKAATQSGVTQIAYHFDRPMVVTNVGGLPEIVPDGVVGYVVERDPTAIADAIVDFYDADRSAEFVANIKVEKKRFGWDHFAKQVLALAERVPTR